MLRTALKGEAEFAVQWRDEFSCASWAPKSTRYLLLLQILDTGLFLLEPSHPPSTECRVVFHESCYVVGLRRMVGGILNSFRRVV